MLNHAAPFGVLRTDGCSCEHRKAKLSPKKAWIELDVKLVWTEMLPFNVRPGGRFYLLFSGKAHRCQWSHFSKVKPVWWDFVTPFYSLTLFSFGSSCVYLLCLSVSGTSGPVRSFRSTTATWEPSTPSPLWMRTGASWARRTTRAFEFGSGKHRPKLKTALRCFELITHNLVDALLL